MDFVDLYHSVFSTHCYFSNCRFFSLGICITKLHCISIASVRSAEQHSNSLPFRIFILLGFSLQSLPTLPFSEFAFFWKLTFFSAKSTVFRRLRRLQMPKRMRRLQSLLKTEDFEEKTVIYRQNAKSENGRAGRLCRDSRFHIRNFENEANLLTLLR